MAYHSKYTGLQIDDILDSVESKQGKIEDLASIRAGAQKGATALQSYTEKYTGTVTGIKINGETKSGSGVIDLGTISTDISGKVDKVAGKQLSTEDFTTALKTKLEGLNNYDDTELSEAIETLRGDFDEIVSGDTTTAIKTFNEVIAFLDGIQDTQDLSSIIASIEQQIAGKQEKLVSGTNIKTINGESILGEGDLTIESGADIIVASKSDLDEFYKDVQEGTKAVVVNNVSDVLGVNLFDFFMGTIEGAEEVFTYAEAYTLRISSVDANVELPISDTADVSVELPFDKPIRIDMGSDLASVYRIFVSYGYREEVWSEGIWMNSSYLLYNEIHVSQLINLDDNAIVGLMTISPALIVDFVGTKSITEYVKNGDNWEVWSKGKSGLDTQLMEWASFVSQNIPTKTSQLENDSNFITSEDVAAVATSGSYNDLTNKPTIPSAVTESTVSGWGFTKNTGTYSKPSGGIPKTDLASAVQTSLGKADTALQSYTEQYKGTITGVSANGTSVATSGVANIPAASTSKYGVTKLSSATNSTSTSLAATASAVKSAYDLANGKQEKLVSGTNIKTINGTSILGSGDIIIESGGGSSSGSGAYSEVNHGTSDTTFTLTPNTFHIWDEVANLTLTLGSETSGVANEFLFQFTSGATATTLSLPSDLKWANDAAPVIAENMIYQVSVLKGLASVLEFKNTPSVTLITFYYNGTAYQAEEGMTWAEFVDSGYNSGGFYVEYGYVFTGNYQQVYHNYMMTTPAEQIVSNAFYDNNSGGGSGGGM